jgi:uncharacterized protein
MILDLRRIFSEVGSSLSIDDSIDMSDYEIGGVTPVKEPIAYVGCIKNSAGVVSLSYDAKVIYTSVCDRCAEPTTKVLPTMHFEHIIVTEQIGEDEEYIVAEDMQIDLDEIIRCDVALNLPSKFLCKDDCKGICSGCGRNLNKEACVCKKEIDPRLAVLQQLLDD